MRIMHISNNYTPYSGGVVSSLNALLPSLQAANHDTMLITLNFVNDTTNDPSWVYRIPSLFTMTYHNNPLAVPHDAYSFIKKKVENYSPDVIHVHHPFLLGVIGRQIAHEYAIPCIFTYHTMYEKYAHYIPLPQGLVQPVIKNTVLFFCKEVTAIITPSKGIKQYLEQNVTTPLHVLASPLQNHFLASKIEKKSHKVFELLSVGRFMPEKNIAFLIHLYAKLNSPLYRLTLVGYGAEESDLRWLAYDHYRFNEKQIRFVIKPDSDSLCQLYQEADLFLFSSQTDTQGLVLAESMVNGTPVVALPGAGQEDIIEQGVNGFIVNSEKEMMSIIGMLTEDRLSLKILSENACKTAQRFNASAITKRLIDIYNNYI